MLLPINKHFLTASECELLAWLYLDPNNNTPISLSQNSGMKKEAVSRCLKSLYKKRVIRIFYNHFMICGEQLVQTFIFNI